MEWLVHDLKPTIDSKYATYPWREATGIGGSSMGGLMSFYGVMAFNQYFFKAACLSPSFVFCMNQLQVEWDNAQIDNDTNVFFIFGEREIKDHNIPLQQLDYFNDQLINRGGKSYIHIQKNGKHNEACWKQQNKLYLDTLWK